MPFGFVCQRTGGIAFLGESGVDPDLQRRSYTDNLLTSLFLLLSFTSVMFASLFKIPTGKKVVDPTSPTEYVKWDESGYVS